VENFQEDDRPPARWLRQLADWLRRARPAGSPPITYNWHSVYIFGVIWSVALGLFDQIFQSSGFSIGVFAVSAVIGLAVYAPAVRLAATYGGRRSLPPTDDS
jgi:hypothetical protein